MPIHRYIIIAFILVLSQDNALSQNNQTEEIEEVIVIGSRLSDKNINNLLPATYIDSETIDLLGIDSGDELLRSIIQQGTNKFNDAGNAIAGVNSARGDIGAYNLRNLGTGNTLVLLNGRRMINSPGFQSESVGGSFIPVNSVNTNTLPIGGIERLEILRDGASAIYGADAVAGVVNTVLDRDYEGFSVSAKYSEFENFARSDNRFIFKYGSEVNGGRGHLTLFYSLYDRDPIRASEDERMGVSDWRNFPEISGTKWDSTRFRRDSTNSPYGQFDVIPNVSNYEFFNLYNLTDSAGEFEIFPAGDTKCKVKLSDDSCIASDTATKRYNMNSERWIYSKLKRDNLSISFDYDLNENLSFFSDLLYYKSDTTQNNSPSAAFSTSRIIVPANNYWNPFGPLTFPDGTNNPNRIAYDISGQDISQSIPDEGLPILIDWYRYVDIGPRVVNVEKDTYRILFGLKGEFRNWNWETAVFSSKANTDDITSNRLSNTLVERALALSSPNAYNPFNGGGNYINYISTGKDGTPNRDSAIESAIIDVYRKGERELNSVDFKIINNSIFSLRSGKVSFAGGLEFRSDKFEDDRDPRLDGTIKYTDKDGDTFPFVSDVMNSSPTPDNSGKRDVFSVYTEFLVPLVSEEMNISLIRSLNLQIAGRYEDFSDIGSKSVPKIAIGWEVTKDLFIRGSLSKGFRVPNLIQINESIVSRQLSRDDAYLCLQQIRSQGQIDDCDYSIQRVAQGSKKLKPENSTNTSIGLIYNPSFVKNLNFSLDWWEIEKEDTIGLFGENNLILSDLILRLNSNDINNCSNVKFNENVIRESIDPSEAESFLNVGLCPVGAITRVEDFYRNLDTRIISGFDLGIDYNFSSRFGFFNISVNATKIDKFIQKAGPDVSELLEAQQQGLIPSEFSIQGFSDLLKKDGSPEIQANLKLLWQLNNWGAGLFLKHTGDFVQTRVRAKDGEYWTIDEYNKVSGYLDYTINRNSNQTRLRFGINNIFDERAPLSSDIFGYYFDLHDNLGRYYYFDIKYDF